MRNPIEVYVRSFPPPRDLEAALFARQHGACAPQLLRQELPDLQGRILDSSSVSLLTELEELSQQSPGTLRLHDVGHLHGRLKAAWAGVWQTPAVVIDGKKHIGVAAAREALSAIGLMSVSTKAALKPE